MTFSPQLIQGLRDGGRVAVLTGAGISAESGVPTFRGKGGLWRQHRPEELATPQAFARDPELVWEWYAYRRDLIGKVKPNPGHYALTEIGRRCPTLTLITQNVDGLHQAAGLKDVIELHGGIMRSRCTRCGILIPCPTEAPETASPLCDCGGRLRPDVVWFGEGLPEAALHAAWDAAQSASLFLSIGTSALVQPAASLPLVALDRGAWVVEINPDPTPITGQVHESLRGKAGDILPALVSAVWPDAEVHP